MNDSRCPGCRYEVSGDAPERDGAVLTCAHCGYVGIWDTELGEWRLLTTAEHADLMQEEAFLESLQFGIAFRAWRERDRAVLCALIHSQLDRQGIAASVISDLTDEIMAAQYHTHPTDDDISALGLDKYEGLL